MCNNKSVQSLSVEFSSVGDVEQSRIAKILYVNKTLTNLDITQSSMSLKMLTKIIKSLQHNTTLQKLKIACFDMYDKKIVKNICRMLSRNKTLTVLKIVNTEIHETQIERIFAYLENNTTLRTIHIHEENDINDDCDYVIYHDVVINIIVNSVRNNYSLTDVQLDVRSCEINDVLERNKNTRFVKTKAIINNM